jgi:hypothetical protein
LLGLPEKSLPNLSVVPLGIERAFLQCGATYVERPRGQVLFLDISPSGNGAVICPAFQRGRRPLASMKFAMRGADQSDALKAHCRAGLSRLGISSRGVIV